MLKSDYVEVAVNGSLKVYFEKKGLVATHAVDCPKCGSKDFAKNGFKADGRKVVRCRDCRNSYIKNQYPSVVTVHVSQLPDTSKTPVVRVCDTCQKQESIMWCSYTRALPNRMKTGEDNCKSCANKKAQTIPDKAKRVRNRYNIEEITWAAKVKEKDNYTCLACNQVGKSLVSHHVIPWIKNPSLRYAVENGVTLCSKCHEEYHSATGGKKSLKNCNADTLNAFILKKGMGILGMEWQNSTQGHWESASQEGKHGEKTASTIDGQPKMASGLL